MFGFEAADPGSVIAVCTGEDIWVGIVGDHEYKKENVEGSFFLVEAALLNRNQFNSSWRSTREFPHKHVQIAVSQIRWCF